MTYAILFLIFIVLLIPANKFTSTKEGDNHMDENELRLECLKLAFKENETTDRIIKDAKAFSDYILDLGEE